MDGIHDLGGKQGYGRVEREVNEPAFHERWEALVFALMLASRSAGAWRNTDQFRHLIERIDPVAYLTHGYYGRWLGGIEVGLVEASILTETEIESQFKQRGGIDGALIASHRVLLNGKMANPTQAKQAPAEDTAAQGRGAKRSVPPPRFKLYDPVVTSTVPTPGHTRLPAYARGRQGNIVACHDGWVFPDSNAHLTGEDPQHLYTVKFTACELWHDAETNANVCLDLFEPYLTLATTTQGEA